MKKILVTGCAGFIGFSLCKFLLKRKFKIIGIDSLNSYYNLKLKKKRIKLLKKKNFDFLKVDLSERDKFFKKIQKKNLTQLFI
tara:strand:+ start:548 stop:796 length:249 start_codon:yes stop_codon:yes gene_type:complete